MTVTYISRHLGCMGELNLDDALWTECVCCRSLFPPADSRPLGVRSYGGASISLLMAVDSLCRDPVLHDHLRRNSNRRNLDQDLEHNAHCQGVARTAVICVADSSRGHIILHVSFSLGPNFSR